MSKPLAAKGTGAQLKCVLNSRLMAGPAASSRRRSMACWIDQDRKSLLLRMALCDGSAGHV